MSTFLQTLAVVVLSIAAATAVAVKDPSQPATLTQHPKGAVWKRRLARFGRSVVASPRHLADSIDRWRRRRRRAKRERLPTLRPQPVVAPVGGPTVPAGPGHFTDGWLPARPRSSWARARSGVVLTLLLTVVGALLAATVAGVIVAAALALRSAVS